jgi:hypothetical protein
LKIGGWQYLKPTADDLSVSTRLRNFPGYACVCPAC